jgi:hypothetical protein
MAIHEGPLGRRVPTNFSHIERYPLTAAPTLLKPTPVVIGTSWYSAFDNPQKDSNGNYWIARDYKPGGNLGRIRGGHCVCLKPKGVSDSTRRQIFYDQGREGACFPAGTMVEMADGSHRVIEDVRPLERVMTAEGSDGLVLASMARMHVDGLVTLQLRGHRHLRATADHPILTRRGYVALGQLNVGDEVRLPARTVDTTRFIKPAQWLAEHELRVEKGSRIYAGVSGRDSAAATIAKAPDQIELTPEFGWIIGTWLGDGGTTAQKVQWTMGGERKLTEVVPRLVDLLRTLGCEPRVQVRPDGVRHVIVYGKHWRLLFERMMSLGPYDKRLPPELASGPKEFLAGVLQGWIDTDGHRRRTATHGVTVSHTLAMDMYRIAQILGRAPTIRTAPGKPNASAASRRQRWDIEISDGSPQASVDAGGVWRKVQGVEHEDWAGFVFNLEVEGDHSYVAEGIGVHNCVGFGISRMTTILNGGKLYLARWLWDKAKASDEWSDTNPGDDNGTSVRAGLDVLRTQGHVPWRSSYEPLQTDWSKRDELAGSPGEGIKVNRWATSTQDALNALGYGSLDYVDILNSWGLAWPHVVRMPATVLERLRQEDGEIGIVTDL